MIVAPRRCRQGAPNVYESVRYAVWGQGTAIAVSGADPIESRPGNRDVPARSCVDFGWSRADRRCWRGRLRGRDVRADPVLAAPC